MTSRYSIIGLGKLGASMAVAIASRGGYVIGVDTNLHNVEMINSGHAPLYETNLEQLLFSNRSRISATRSYRDAILNSTTTFVVVPTPSDKHGAFSLKFLIEAFSEIGDVLAEKRTYHNIVLTSTVLPGSTRYGLLPILENRSGKKCGRDFGLCYSPEFIALGSIIHDFLNPYFTLIGEFDEYSGAQLEACYSQLTEKDTPCKRMSIENAELTKLALNTYITTKITFANMLGDLCERIPGGNVELVTEALGLDQRIGSKYLTSAMGYGGPCFPRDNAALGFIARQLGMRVELAETTDLLNRQFPKRSMDYLRPFLKNGMVAAVLGLAYKPSTDVIEESQGIYLVKELIDAGIHVIAYDPLCKETAKQALGGSVLVYDSLDECLSNCNIVLITTPDQEFKALTPTSFHGREIIVVDYWRILANTLKGQEGIIYVPMGLSIDDIGNEMRLKNLWSQDSNSAD